MLKAFRNLFFQPIQTPLQWVIVAMLALAFVLMPQLPNNDWQRNAADIPNGLNLYQNPAYVYPPWALLLLAPYYLMTAAGSRIASVLVIAWFMRWRGYSLGRFALIVLSPLFFWTMVLSSADVLLLLLPIILWEVCAGKRGETLARAVALALLLLKPQVGGLLSLLRQPRQLLAVLAALLAITLPISLIGSPPLLLQWVDNLLHPPAVNLDHWTYNNLSLTYRYGFPFAIAVVTLSLGGLYGLMRQRGYRCTNDHVYAALFLASMLLAPYASNQSAIVPLALLPSGLVTLMQYVGVLGAAILNLYALADDWLVLIFTLTAMWQHQVKARTPVPALDRPERAQFVSSGD
jgi:hypothetical protein